MDCYGCKSNLLVRFSFVGFAVGLQDMYLFMNMVVIINLLSHPPS